MKDAFEKLFRAVHQFKKLNVSDLVPGLSSSERKNYKLRAGGEDQNTSAGCVAHTARTGRKRICRAER